MNDPYYAGSYPEDDFQEHFRTKRYRYGVLKMQGMHHAVRLMQKGLRGDDQLIADRLKHMFDLLPMNTAIVSVNGEDYFMMEAPFTFVDDHQVDTTQDDGSTKVPPIQMYEPELLTYYEEDWMENRSFRLEVCKIFLFRWIIGCRKTSLDDIEIWNGWPVSTNELRFGTYGMDSDVVQLLSTAYSDVLDEAMTEVCSDAKFDHLRGCLAQKRCPIQSVDHMRLGNKYALDVRDLLRKMEERIDILETMTSEEFICHHEQ